MYRTENNGGSGGAGSKERRMMQGRDRERMRRDRKLGLVDGDGDDLGGRGGGGSSSWKRSSDYHKNQQFRNHKTTPRKITILDGISVTSLSDLIGVSYGKTKNERNKGIFTQYFS